MSNDQIIQSIQSKTAEIIADLDKLSIDTHTQRASAINARSRFEQALALAVKAAIVPAEEMKEVEAVDA